MIKKTVAIASVLLTLLAQRPHAQANPARIFFIDVGTGASTLIVSPTGKTLLVDGGPPGSGAKIIGLLDTLGIATIDFTVLTHYHIDHMGGLIEVLNAGRVAGTSFDNGDGAGVQPPGTSTSSSSTRGTYLNYVTATGHSGVTRKTVVAGAIPDGFLDLGGGMRATFMVAGGRFLSGGSVAITNEDLNSESISTLVEYNAFDYLVSGDMTGGGSTSTAKTPDVETYVAQMVGDVDVVQLDHHGSTTANNQVFLSALKAEVAFAQTGETNTFGHPNRETANKFLNTPDTAGSSFTGTGVPPVPSVGPVFYQNEASPAGDDRVTQQGYTGTAAGNAGHGTVLLSTDGSTTYTMSSFDDGGARISPAQHTYTVDGVSPGITTDFKPTVIAQTSPLLPRANEDVVVSAAVNDRESPIATVSLAYSVDGVAQAPLAMALAGGLYQATIPAQANGARVDYTITGSTGSQSSSFSLGYFSGVTPIGSLRAQTAKGEPLYNGYAARIQGTVTASGFSPGTNDDYVQDATAAINVYRSTDTPTGFTSTTPGQVVEVSGRINFNGGRLRLDLTESVEKTSSPFGILVLSSGAAPTPTPTTIAALSTNPESLEGKFVSLANVTIVGTIPATPQSSDAFVTISDGTGSFSMKVDHDTDVEGFTPATPFTLVGILQQDDYLRPFDSGYNVTPRSRVDLGASAPAPTPLVTIGDARIDQVNNVDGTPGADFVPDRLNQIVRIHGVVSTIDFRGGNGIEYYVQDGTGGVDLFNSATNFGPFAIGDTVDAVGTVTQFFGLTEITVSSMALLSHDAAPTPQAITLSQLAAGGGEAFEGQLVTVSGVRITSGVFPALNSSGAVTIADATGTGALYIDSDTNIDGTATPAGSLTITGVLGQHATTSLDNSYQIIPSELTDIVADGGSGPALTAAPATLTFAATSVGSVLLAPVTITNNGTSSLTLTTPFAVTGTDATQFTVSAPAAATLASGASTTASVTFAPTAAGVKSATLNIGSSNGSTSVALAGTATSPGGGSTPSLVISEFRLHGTAGGNDEFVEIYNNTDAPADISGYTLRGSNNAGTNSVRATVPANVILPGRSHYLFTNTAANGYSLPVPGNVTYAVGITDDGGLALFTPGTGGTVVDAVGLSAGSAFKEGSTLAPLTTNANRGYERLPGGAAINLQDTNDNAADFQQITPSAPQNIVLSAAPSTVNFGAAAPGDTRAQTITITNLLATAVTLDAPTLTGSDAPAFAAATPSTTSLTAGATATIVVTFAPLDSGGKSASLVVTSTSAGSVSIPLSGTGTGGLAVSPGSVDFGTVQPGASASSAITVTNTDATGVTLTPPFAIAGANPEAFSAGTPAGPLASGESTSFAVSFQPPTSGPKSASLLITTSAGAARTVTLTGVGTCDAIIVGGSLPSGTVGLLYGGAVTASGADGPYTFTIASGAPPGGLAISPNGVISGTPTTVGVFSFTVQASVAGGCSGTGSFSITVAPPPIVITAAPATLDFGVVPASTTASSNVTLTNVSLTPIVLATPVLSGNDAALFVAGTPAATALDPGTSTTVEISFAPVGGGLRTATLAVSANSGATATVTLTGAGSVATPVLISEFRSRGPAGGNDEFVEIYNNTDAAIDISGYTLHGSNNAGTNSTRATVPLNTTLPARSRYLFVNTAAAGYSGTTPGNLSYSTGITDDGGIALIDNHGTIVDQVGFSSGSLYKEGATLAPLTASAIDRSYERAPGSAATTLQDTDDNATDFHLETPSNPQNIVLVASPASVDFGSIVQTTSTSQSIAIKNLLLNSVTLDEPTISGTDAGDVIVGILDSSVLAGGASATVSATFHPATTGSKSASLAVTSTSGGATTVPLTGTSLADTTVPVLTVPEAISLEATGPTTAVTYSATALDSFDGPIVPFCSPASGSAFSVGITPVNCTATDPHGNSANASFTVTITDHIAPTLTLPANITATATAPSGTVVTFNASALDLVDGMRPVACAPASGATFPIGTTQVSCGTNDNSGNAASGSFTVAVTPPLAPGRMTGIFTINTSNVTHGLAFDVQERANGAGTGALFYTIRTKQPGADHFDTFQSTAVTAVSFFDAPGVSPGPRPQSGLDVASFSGIGRWNSHTGYTFDAVATDAGEPGRGRDSFVIAVKDPAGSIVATINATITEGNIQSLPQTR